MVKVKILKDSDTTILEGKINGFMKDSKIEVLDVKFEIERPTNYAMVIYRDRQING